jgi:hypothetical protein
MIRSARHPHLAPSATPEKHPQIPDYLQATAITLGVDGVSVTLLPDAGLRVGSIVIGGRELLVRENGHPATWGIFPMAPWAGRIANATFTDLAGATHQFPPTWGDHAFHGRLYQCSANEQSISGDGTSAVMYAPLDHAAGWPLNARAEVSAELHGNAVAGALSITLTITAEVAQRVTAGWHPCFRRFLLVPTGDGSSDTGVVLVHGRVLSAAAVLAGLAAGFGTLLVARASLRRAVLICLLAGVAAVWIVAPFDGIARAAWWASLAALTRAFLAQGSIAATLNAFENELAPRE